MFNISILLKMCFISKSNQLLTITSVLKTPAGKMGKVGIVPVISSLGKPVNSFSVRLNISNPAPAHTKTTSPPMWADRETRHGLINFVQAMAYNWPSWVNNSEFLLLPVIKRVLDPKAFATTFNVGWKVIGKKLTIPICLNAQIEDPASSGGWPVVVFSHGMGCNRFIMSQLCYQLASQGVVVAAVEHRDGSGCGSFYMLEKDDGKLEKHMVPHRTVPIDDGDVEYLTRNEQIQHRSDELIRVIDILAKLNAGEQVENVVEVDQMSRQLDLTSIKSCLDLNKNLFLLGHSFGGGSVLLTASKDSRVKSVLALDPWMFPVSRQNFVIDTPAYVLNTDKFLNQNNINVIREASKDNHRVKFKVLRGGVHLSATDVPAIFPSTFIRRSLGFMDKVDPGIAMRQTNQMVLEWFKRVVC